MKKKRIAILQSMYIPWKGYFDIIKAVDVFIVYDDVQYTKRSWRNRNKIVTKSGPQMLTIPIFQAGRSKQLIQEVRIADPLWNKKHWLALQCCYAKAPHFREYKELLEELYSIRPERTISEVNVIFLRTLSRCLGITTSIEFSRDYNVPSGLGKTERLVELCKRAGGEVYLNGPAGKSYIDESLFSKSGIELCWVDYSGYPVYPQLCQPFDHQVSILDLLFHTGPRALEYIKRMF